MNGVTYGGIITGVGLPEGSFPHSSGRKEYSIESVESNRNGNEYSGHVKVRVVDVS